MNVNEIYIIGAGPAGLACSYYLSKAGFKVSLLEEKNIIGGLARSWEWNNFILDTGPHIFHTPYEEIENDWQEIFGDLLIKKKFYAGNFRKGKYYNYPIDISQLEKEEEFEIDVQNFKNGHSFGDLASAKTFKEYVSCLVGENISNAFFKEYPEKLWGIKSSSMSSEWAPKRIRITEKKEKFFGNEFTSIGKFGTGSIMQRLGDTSKKYGCSIKTSSGVKRLEYTLSNGRKRINKILLKNGKCIEVNKDDHVIITIPINRALALFNKKTSLNFRGTLSLYAEIDGFQNLIPDGYDWLYFQNKKDIINRISVPTNWSKDIDLKNENRHLINAEVSIDHNINANDLKLLKKKSFDSLKKLLKEKSIQIKDTYTNLERYVYPVKTLDSKIELSKSKKFFGEINNLEVLGTGANFNYGDMQVMFMKAKEIASEIKKPTEESLSKIAFLKRYQVPENFIKKENLGTKIIAELGINHNGSFSELQQLIRSASNAGAHYIKFQYYKTEERIDSESVENKLVEKAQDMEESTFDILSENKLSISQLKESKMLVESLGCSCMTTVFGIKSLEEALEIGFKDIKIASMDLNNIKLFEKIVLHREKIKNLFISTGMSSIGEIALTLNFLNKSNIKPILMACTSAYPCSDEELNLNILETYKSKFSNQIKDIGYSDHSIGNTACLAASCLGANYLEIHFTNSEESRGPDHVLSTTAENLNTLKDEIKRIEKMKGSFQKFPRASEYETWRLQKKGVYASKNIKKGEIIDLKNILIKSPPYGLGINQILNKNLVAQNSIKKGEPITLKNSKKQFINDDLIAIRKKYEEAINLSNLYGKKLITVLVSTKNTDNKKAYSGGLRFTEQYVIQTIVNLKQSQLSKIKRIILEASEYIFVDAEKVVNHEKLEYGTIYGNLLSELSNNDLNGKIRAFKPSQLTVNSAVRHIRKYFKQQLAGKKIGILGVGSIGFRITSTLLEEAATVCVYSRTSKTLKIKVDVIEEIKPKSVLSSIKIKDSIKELLNECEFIVCSSSQPDTLTKREILNIDVKKLPKYFLDVGKNNISEECIQFFQNNKSNVSRLDIGDELIAFIEMEINSSKRKKSIPKSKIYHGKTFVSGGYIGNSGDYVVDDADDPKILIGEINNDRSISPIIEDNYGDILHKYLY